MPRRTDKDLDAHHWRMQYEAQTRRLLDVERQLSTAMTELEAMKAERDTCARAANMAAEIGLKHLSELKLLKDLLTEDQPES